MSWKDQAPSNIALIKYMGKVSNDTNIPANPSLSYTLNNLLTFVEIEPSTGDRDSWELLTRDDCPEMTLSKNGQEKFLNHFKRIKDLYGVTESFIVKSNNNFPAATGMASSASAFAALTKCATSAICDIQKQNIPSDLELANLSKLGSGSSCRSFFSPYAIWNQKTVEAIDLPYPNLLHQTIVISKDPKSISSTKAHELVKSSPNYHNRINSLSKRLQNLIDAFSAQDWSRMYQIVKQEFLDMHELFETSQPTFSYMTGSSKIVIDRIQDIWESNKDGPLITMDAGPNIHLLYRTDQTKLFNEIKDELGKNCAII